MTTTTTKASTTSTTSMFRPSLLFLSTNAFDAGNRTKHHRRNNSVLICVVLVVCWFCWDFVLASKRRIRPRYLAVNGKTAQIGSKRSAHTKRQNDRQSDKKTAEICTLHLARIEAPISTRQADNMRTPPIFVRCVGPSDISRYDTQKVMHLAAFIL